MAPIIMGTPERPELDDELTESFCRTDPARALVFARTTFLSDNRADLPRVTVPTLVIECAHDTLAPREVGDYVHEHIAGSQLVTLDATGHCPHLSAPDDTAAGDRRVRRPSVTPRPDPPRATTRTLRERPVRARCRPGRTGASRPINCDLVATGLDTSAMRCAARPFTDLLSVGSRIHYETHFGSAAADARPDSRASPSTWWPPTAPACRCS